MFTSYAMWGANCGRQTPGITINNAGMQGALPGHTLCLDLSVFKGNLE